VLVDAGDPDAVHRARPKQLIEFGWDLPDADFLSRHLNEMQRSVFDGVVFTAKRPIPRAFDDRAWTADELNPSVLAGLDWGRLEHSFMLFRGPEAQAADWFDDQRWRQIKTNMGVLARAAKTSGARGVLFDPEFYGERESEKDPWIYREDLYPGRSLAEVGAQVRQRGSEFIEGLQAGNSEMKFLSLFFPSYQYQRVGIPEIADDQHYARMPKPLMFFFFEGVIEAASSKIELIDGHETSYFNDSGARFTKDHRDVHETGSFIAPELKSRWSEVQFGPGIFMDYLLGMWPLAGTEFADLPYDDRLAWLKHNVYWALQSADEYAWFYSERAGWWRRDALQPPDVSKAVRQAKALVDKRWPLGYSVEASRASDAQAATIDISPGVLGLTGRPARSRNAAVFSVRRAAGAKGVTLIVDGLPVGADSRAPFKFRVRGLSPGRHEILARASW
jgi:hypothetical protein